MNVILSSTRSVLIILLSVCFFPAQLIAQESNQSGTPEQDIFTHIAMQRSGGNVTISQPDWLRDMIVRNPHAPRAISSGYRIQVYTNNMRGAKEEAYSLANQLKGLLPELSCYVSYRAPFWRLSIGDYRSRQEAQTQLNALRSTYPQLMREAYIVREKIRTP